MGCTFCARRRVSEGFKKKNVVVLCACTAFRGAASSTNAAGMSGGEQV